MNENLVKKKEQNEKVKEIKGGRKREGKIILKKNNKMKWKEQKMF